ncbi:MAG: hypothetical protein HYW48_10890 [Deltaproteobacteria bacterium]|nr:hypothetical protein [Deltaproteobacteria bacterium]
MDPAVKPRDDSGGELFFKKMSSPQILFPKYYRCLAISFLIVLLFSCTTPKHSVTWKELDRFTELSENQKARQEKAKHQSELCQQIVETLSPAYAKLSKFIVGPVNARDPLIQLSKLKKNDCVGNDRWDVFRLISRGINEHNTKIGVILPLSSTGEIGKTLLRGIKSGMEGSGSEQVFVFKDRDTTPSLDSLLAQLVFRDKVGLIIGGVNAEDASRLAAWSEDLLLPSLLIVEKRSVLYSTPERSSHPYVFPITLAESSTARALAMTSHQKQLRRVSFLRPLSGKADELCTKFRKELQKFGIEVTHDIQYEAGDYRSMDSAVMTVTGTGTAERMAEYRDLYEKKFEEAKKQGLRFSPHSVVLPPLMDADAVFIPDDFRIVRHFVNLFKYHGIDKVTMIGNNEWRSSALIQPWDPFLHGSFFADHVGSYAKLPGGMQYEFDSSEYFVLPSVAGQIDLQMMGYHAAKIALSASQNPLTTKREIVKKLRLLPQFSKDNVFEWPIYLFTIKDRRLEFAWKLEPKTEPEE